METNIGLEAVNSRQMFCRLGAVISPATCITGKNTAVETAVPVAPRPASAHLSLNGLGSGALNPAGAERFNWLTTASVMSWSPEW